MRLPAVGLCLGLLAAASGAATQETRGLLLDSLAGAAYRSLRVGDVTVHFAATDSLLAPRVAGLLADQEPLPGLGDGVPTAVSVVLAHTPEAFDELTGGVVPEWRAGVAVPDLNLLVLPSGEGRSLLDEEGRRTLRHEWAHLGLHQFLGHRRVPRWFDEGYAQWASAGFDATEAWRLRILMALGRTPPLDSLVLDWPRDRASAGAAYLLAASAVTYLLGESGERGLELFLRRWRAEGSFDSALRDTFGVTGAQFEADWKRHVRARYGWLFVLSHSAVSWMVLALVLLLMMRVRQAYNRERMARLRAGEPPDRPAFWAQSGEDAASPPAASATDATDPGPRPPG